MSGAEYFLYFAYGSNLLKERLLLKNSSAEFYSVARLQDYVLRFGVWQPNVTGLWHGGSATIEKCPGEDIWGVVWKMVIQDIASLDKQENGYNPLEVTVETQSGPLLCRTYEMRNCIPSAPSLPYKKVIFLGAKQNGLPEDYIKKLQAMETNNYTGPTPLDDILKHKNWECA